MRSQPLSPTPTHFSTKTTHSHLFFDKSDPLPPIFQWKQPTPTHFLTKTTHSHPFFNKNNPLLPIFQEKNPTPTNFSAKTTHLPIFQQKRSTPTHFLTKTTHPWFFNKTTHSHPRALLNCSPSNFYPFSGILILLHCKRLALMHFLTNTTNFWPLISSFSHHSVLIILKMRYSLLASVIYYQSIQRQVEIMLKVIKSEAKNFLWSWHPLIISMLSHSIRDSSKSPRMMSQQIFINFWSAHSLMQLQRSIAHSIENI